MKILFLDIDGVLNTNDFLDNFGDRMNPFLVHNLITVVNQTGCSIVISSDWRQDGIGENSDFQRALFCEGFVDAPHRNLVTSVIDKIIDVTLDISPEDYSIEGEREFQIKEWIESHNPNHWVAVDDLILNLPDDNFLLTDPTVGLNMQAADNLIAKLNKNGKNFR